MSVDIGPRIGVDGEAEFRKSLANINQQIKTLGSEMKAVTSAFEGNEHSQEALAAQADVLNRQIDAQEQKLSALQSMLEQSAQRYGENDTRTLRWAQAVQDATADLNRMRNQLSRTEREMDGLTDSTDDAEDAMDDLSGASDGLIGGLADLKAGFDLVWEGLGAIMDIGSQAVQAFFDLADATEEYRTAQGKLNTAFEAAGYGPETASKAYTEFYKILGDTDTATEASQLLANLVASEKDIATWTQIAAGVAGTFGDSLPIEGLIEAANETAKVGQVTGALADVVNWGSLAGETFGVTLRENTKANEEWNKAVTEASSAEDYFNLALQECSTESERNQLIMDALSQGYDQASDAFYRNNEELVKTRENQALAQESTGNLGGAVQELKNDINTDFTPAISGVVDAFADVVAGADGAKENLSTAISELITEYSEKLPEYAALGADIIESVGQGMIENSDQLVSAGEDAMENFRKVILELLLSMGKSMGKNLISGMLQGWKESIGWVITQFEESCGGLVAAIKRILGIHSPSTVFRDEVGRYIALGVAEGIEDSTDDAVKAANDLAESVYKKSAEWIDRQAKYQGYSLEEQLEVWETIQNQFIVESKQYADAEERIFDLKADIQAEYFSKAKKRIEQQTKYQGLSLQEQLKAWRAVQDKFVAESQQYAEAEEKILDLKKRLQDEYYSKVEEVQEKITKLEQDYQDKLAQRTKAIFETYGLFDQVPEREEVSGDELISNLKGQIATIEDFYDGLRVLAERGVGDALVDDIREMGPDAIDELNALLSLSDKKLSEYAALYQAKQSIANQLAMEELADLRDETNKQISQNLDELQRLYVNYAPTVGAALTDGLVEGIYNGMPSVISAAEAMAQSVVSVVKNILDPYDSNSLFFGLGEDGFGSELVKQVGRSMEQLSTAQAAISVPSQASQATVAMSDGMGADIAGPIAAAVRSALQGAGVYLNGRRVGVLVTQSQNSAAVARGQSQVYV